MIDMIVRQFPSVHIGMVCTISKRLFDQSIPIISEGGPTYKFEVRWTPGEEKARCKTPERPAPGGGSWGTDDGELIAEPGSRRGFELYDSFPFERK